MLRAVDFVPSDWMTMQPRDYERRFDREVGDPKVYAQALRDLGCAWALVDEQARVLGCGGILKIKPGVGELWGRFSVALPVERPSRQWVEAFRLIDQELEAQLVSTFHRLQIAIPLQFHPGIRFAYRLGFVTEAKLRQYGTDRSDYLALARLRPGEN